MKVRCIKSARYVTKGFYYEIRDCSDSDLFFVVSDDKTNGFYKKDLFNIVSVERDKKINEIIN